MAYTVYYNTPGTLLTYAQIQSAILSLSTSNSWTYQTFGQSENEVDIDGVIINPTGYTWTVFIQCGIHGYERWPIRAALDLLNYFDTTPAAINNNVRYIIVPCLNPDGYANDTRQNDNDYSDDGVDPWPRQVDLNRNFTPGWSDDGSSNPANSFYYGPAAMSESETNVCADIFSTYIVDLFIDTHSTLDYIDSVSGYYPYYYPTITSALTSNGFTAYSRYGVDSTLGGSAIDFGVNSGKTESFIIELNESASTINEEINRYICAIINFISALTNTSNTHNNFLKDTSCKAHYRFNKLGLGLIDEFRNVDLLPQNSPMQDTVNFFSGDASSDLGSVAYYKIYDASLPSDFPLKSGTTNKEFGYAIRFKANTLPSSGGHSCIISKYQSGGNLRSFFLTLSNYSGVYKLRMFIGYNSGAAGEEVLVLTLPSLSTTEWYLVAGGIKDSDKSYYHEFWDETERLAYGGGNYTNNINLSTAQLELGSDIGVGASYHFDCNLDDVAIFNTIPTSTKIAEIWADSYSVPGGGVPLTFNPLLLNAAQPTRVIQ